METLFQFIAIPIHCVALWSLLCYVTDPAASLLDFVLVNAVTEYPIPDAGLRNSG